MAEHRKTRVRTHAENIALLQSSAQVLARNPIVLLVTPLHSSEGGQQVSDRCEVRLKETGEVLLPVSSSPIPDAAPILLARGVDPERPIATVWARRPDTIATHAARIGAFAPKEKP